MQNKTFENCKQKPLQNLPHCLASKHLTVWLWIFRGLTLKLSYLAPFWFLDGGKASGGLAWFWENKSNGVKIM